MGGLRGQKQAPAQNRAPSAQSANTQIQGNLAAPTVPILLASNWTNAGTATVEASWQTLRWSLANHDPGVFARAVAWDPNVQTQAQAIFDGAPESARQQFGSVDGVLYAMMMTPGLVDANVTGFGLVSQNITGDDGTLVVQEQRTDGQEKQHTVQMHHFDEGWRVLLPPKMLNQFSEYLNSSQLWANDSISNR